MSPPIQTSKLFADRPVRILGEGLNVGGFSSISIKGQRWSLRHNGETYPFLREDDGSPLTYIDVVILEENPHTSKLYFGDATFTEETAAGPICASVKGDVPDPGVPQPQNPNCPNCRWNQFGSASNGKGKACQDNKRLAIMLMPNMTAKMLGSPLLEPVFFKVPAASLKTFKAYALYLQHQGLSHERIITRINFNPEKNWEIQFKNTEVLSDKAAMHVIDILDNNPMISQMLGQPSISAAPALPPPIQGKLSGSRDLEDAFAAADKSKSEDTPAKRRPGRPPGSPNKAKENGEPKQIEATATEVTETKSDEASSSDDDQWDTSTSAIDADILKKLEADSEVDPKLNNLLNSRMQDVFKKS